ncbi:hypothetical protein NDU88_000487 [Pleurodeles waltl]|uniref:Sex hormone-binding globulin n=1 Tax=Pleurodeles waltl TaxID=8319 RepID=A0AAV7KTK9_PLEWA|nr:hypothetical protein NDU88_000487 [Pleurodeles waltl]
MKTHSGRLLTLLTLLHLSNGDTSHQEETLKDQEGAGLCYGVYRQETEALNIGQHWAGAIPAATKHIDLLQVTSPASSFEFRTFDPEGVIFYGDTVWGQDWFMLGLRNGRPEIQVRNTFSPASVSGCKQINDGQWHLVSVRSEANNIVLHVDQAEVFRVWHLSVPLNESTGTILRIAVGGMLANQSNLLVPMNPAMDGCIRSWNWMNQTKNWLTGPPIKQGVSKHCFAHVHGGSFFSGAGMAIFRSKDLEHGVLKDWSLTLEMHIRPVKDTGLIFAVADGSSYDRPILSLRLNGQEYNLQVGSLMETFSTARMPCEESRLALVVTKTRITLGRGDLLIGDANISDHDYQELMEAWHNPPGRLFFGSLPKELEKYDPEPMVFFEGCMRDVMVQGHPLDMDNALFKSDSIWAHSCPQNPPSA